MSIPAPPLAGDSLSIPESLPQGRAIGSLLRRIVAFAIDAILVGLVAVIIALPFFNTLSHLGPWGRLVGLCLALPYYAILNSEIGNGQTLGKRWMHLQVTNAAGSTISFSKSMVRYFLFAVPYYLNGVILPVSRTPRIFIYALSLIIFGLGGATIYLVLFNRRTRQGIHDLAAGSYVVDTSGTGAPNVQPIWQMHWAILAALFIFVSVGAGILVNKLIKWGPFPTLLEDVRNIEEMEGVQSANAQDVHSRNFGSGDSSTTLVLSVFWTGLAGSEQAVAYEVARKILLRDPRAGNYDSIRVVLIRGYDLGIAHAQVTHSFEHSPAEWKNLLFGNPTTNQSTPTKLSGFRSDHTSVSASRKGRCAAMRDGLDGDHGIASRG